MKAQVRGAEVLAGKPSILEERGVALSGGVRERIHTLFNVVGMTVAAMRLITPALAIVIMILSIFDILLNTLRVRALPLEREQEREATGLSETEFLVPNMAWEGCANTIGTVLTHVHGCGRCGRKWRRSASTCATRRVRVPA